MFETSRLRTVSRAPIYTRWNWLALTFTLLGSAFAIFFFTHSSASIWFVVPYTAVIFPAFLVQWLLIFHRTYWRESTSAVQASGMTFELAFGAGKTWRPKRVPSFVGSFLCRHRPSARRIRTARRIRSARSSGCSPGRPRPDDDPDLPLVQSTLAGSAR